MKKYFLTYVFNGTPVNKDFDTLFEFSQALDKAQETNYMLQTSINFWTETI